MTIISDDQKNNKTEEMGNNDDSSKIDENGGRDRSVSYRHLDTETKTDPMVSRWPEEEEDDNDEVVNDPRRSKNCFYRTITKFYQRWTYSYMSIILKKGSLQDKANGKRLTISDLFPVPTTMRSKYLSDLFRTNFLHSADADNNNINQKKTTNKYENRKKQQKQLLYALWKVAAPTFVPAGLCQLITVLCQVAVPLTVRKILEILETTSDDIHETRQQGIPFAVLLFIIAALNAFANHRHRHLALKSGIVLRSSVVTILYQHVLYLSPAGKEGLTSGEVTNLVATDTQKLFEVAQEGHYIWSLPLSITLVTICLLIVLGPTTLVGIAVLILFVPVIERVTRRMLQIRRKRIHQTDQRIGIVNAMLQGIKVTKLNSYEEKYLHRATEVRNKELTYLRTELAFWALTLVMTVISPVIATATTFAVYVLVSEDNILTASQTFSVLLLFSALRFPINLGGKLIGKVAQALSAVQRVSGFLERDLRVDSNRSGKTDGVDEDKSDTYPLVLKDATFYVGTAPAESAIQKQQQTDLSDMMIHTIRGNAYFKVSKFNLSVRKGEVLAVCGPVGSGKSVLINGIIDELPASHETIVTTSPQIAYISQDAFIINTTLRENVLFGRPYEPVWYNTVIDACGLRTDIELFGRSKDLTEIGERGVTLSGGQKQRVSLARGIYSKPDLILLDDPLSALDAGTSKLVFERLIKGPGALLSNSAVVLVTHAAHFLNRVDRILIVVEGENKFLGSWEELCCFEAPDPKTQGAVDHIRSSVQEAATVDEDGTKGSKPATETKQTEEADRHDKLMTIEERQHGLSSIKTWLLWFQRAGGLFFLITQVLFMTIDRFAYVIVEWWLAWWTNGADTSITVLGMSFPPQTDGRSAQYQYLKVYCLIMLVSFTSTVLRSEWAVTGGARAAKNVHATMLERILEAPMFYFEQTPMGRIINRFTYDTEVIDVTLTEAMAVFMISWSWFFAGIALMCTLVPWMLLALVPVNITYWVLLLYYRKSGSDLQRLDAVSRSPIQAMLAEGMEGGTAMRIYNQQETFIHRFQQAVDTNSSALLNFVTAQRWLGFRVELLGSTISLAASVLVITLNNILQLDPGLVGLLIMWSSNFTITLGYMIDSFAESEAAITSIERVDAMATIPQEKGRKTEPGDEPPASWPEHGQLEFDNVCMRYRPGLPLALNNLSFKIPGGKKCGVVGRTGSGKSSLCSVLFRLVEVESGKITIDGVDLGRLGLSDVRGRPNGMAIIPQDPFLVGSTLRQCIDPFGQSSDKDVLECLKSVRLATETDGMDILDTPVDEGGSNFSVGERQLLNLARALLSKPKILVLDEATASIDGETDVFIQNMLRTKFSGTTQITVAHRLNTIMDFDYVLVMDKGKAAEMGPPGELLLNRDGLFSQLVDATGPEGSKALRAMIQH